LARENFGAETFTWDTGALEATSAGEASAESRIACQRMAGSESSNQSMVPMADEYLIELRDNVDVNSTCFTRSCAELLSATGAGFTEVRLTR
jgi:hypothetical protein